MLALLHLLDGPHILCTPVARDFELRWHKDRLIPSTDGKCSHKSQVLWFLVPYWYALSRRHFERGDSQDDTLTGVMIAE